MIGIKRVYLPPSTADGRRVLVERLWPRGLTKERAAVDLWLKEASPSPELRKWYGHDLQKWGEFKERYLAELRGRPEVINRIRRMAAEGQLTLVYAAHDELHNSAILLKEYLEG
ncbi:MAG TPA: DUF488 domain-containing protein [Anaerolineales bacterium]|nr:DUF488 domain-containing protein [Anaerolineales bacterium]